MQFYCIKRGGSCVCAFVVLEVMSQGTWTLFDELEDPELKSLASKVPNMILHSHADSTVKKYLGAFKRWKKWVATHDFDVIPARPHQFCAVPEKS